MSDQTGAGVTPSPSSEPGTGATPIPTQAGTVVVPNRDAGETPSPGTPSPAGATPREPTSPSESGRRDADADAQRESAETETLGADQLREVVATLRAHDREQRRELKRLQDAEKARADAEKSDLERMTERAQTAEARVAELEREYAARQIAAEAGIPNLWHRLSGADTRALKADAQRIREELQALGLLSQSPGMEGGVRGLGNPPQPASFEDMIRGKVSAR